MKILIFGISCVGKKTVGSLLAKKLNCKFCDMNQVNKDAYGTIEAFLRAYPYPYERAKKQSKTLLNIITRDNEDIVIAVTPISYARYINKILLMENVVAFELQDTADHVFDRILFTDENDVIMEDSEEYKLKHASHYLKEIKSDITFYRKVYKKVENKIFLDGKSAEEGAEMIYEIIQKLKSNE